MAGTRKGGKSAATTNKLKYGADFYARIGAKGGQKSRTGGFAAIEVGIDGMDGQERASYYGRIGGLKSRRISKKDPIVEL